MSDDLVDERLRELVILMDRYGSRLDVRDDWGRRYRVDRVGLVGAGTAEPQVTIRLRQEPVSPDE